MNNKSYKYFDRKASNIVTKLRNKVAVSGYWENLGQNELRNFEEEVDLSYLMFQEKHQLKTMLSQSMDTI
jgi:hypothetical protein